MIGPKTRPCGLLIPLSEIPVAAQRPRRPWGHRALQPRSCGAVHKLPGRPDSSARPQIFRVGLLKQGKHFLCARHCVSGYDSQLIHTQLVELVPHAPTTDRANAVSQGKSSPG